MMQIWWLMIYLRLTHTRLRLSFSRIYHRFNMSTKTLAVLDDAELKDGEMYVHPVLIWAFIFNLINCNRTGRKLVSKMGRFFYLAWAIRCMQLVHIVPTTERLLPKVSWPQTAEWSGKCTAIYKFKLLTFFISPWHGGTSWIPSILLQFNLYSCSLLQCLYWGHRYVVEWTSVSWYLVTSL